MGRTIIADIETDGLHPSKIWCLCALDAETGEEFTFIRPDQSPTLEKLEAFAKEVDTWVFHNGLGFDCPVLSRFCPSVSLPQDRVIDTLVVSRTVDFLRGKHSLADFGVEFGVPKVPNEDWSTFSNTIVERCIIDCRITLKVYLKYLKYLKSDLWVEALKIEHKAASYCQILEQNGFHFNLTDAIVLRDEIQKEVDQLCVKLQVVFPPETALVKEVTPRVTKHGTLLRSQFKWYDGSDLSCFSEGCPFSVLEWVSFNPGSPKQRIDRLWAAGWKPYEKSKGHRDFVKSRKKDAEKKERYDRYGWTTSEENLATLPKDADPAIHTLVRWMILNNRCSTLTQWIEACQNDERIHGQFFHIGAWTQRMSHSAPNMGNVPKFDAKQPDKTPYSDRMRALWGAPPGRLLVGVDAESIQLRILAHYINDEEFTYSLIKGDKKDGTDPHSVNQRALGAPCKSRDDAKTFIYAWLLGAGIGKVAAILGCSLHEAEIARDNFLKRYTGLAYLKNEVIPEDAARGYFRGMDGRYVQIRGEDQGSKEHFTLGGYLQNGEVVIMKHSLDIWYPKVYSICKDFKLVNFVHDEWQLEVPDDPVLAKEIAEIVADSIRETGVNLGLKCPMQGSILNAHGGLAIGHNWMETH